MVLLSRLGESDVHMSTCYFPLRYVPFCFFQGIFLYAQVDTFGLSIRGLFEPMWQSSLDVFAPNGSIVVSAEESLS